MKFISFGDLVEVTYDDGSIELISKEKAYKLGYKEVKQREDILITYKGTQYNSNQFSLESKISNSIIMRYYHKGLRTGEEIIAAYTEQKEIKQALSILYKNNIYNAAQFSTETGISTACISKYYAKGLHTGEEIISAYNRQKAKSIHIPYNGQIYKRQELSKELKIDCGTVLRYYNQGFKTGEEIIAAYNSNKQKIITITYNEKLYTVTEFSEHTNICDTTVRKLYNQGFKTGEEIIAAYNELPKAPSTNFITFKGERYSASQFSKKTGINATAVGMYYKEGLRTGEEIVAKHNKRQRKTIKITYKNKIYTATEFSKHTGIPRSTVVHYYSYKKLHTGEEMIDRYYNKHSRKEKSNGK